MLQSLQSILRRFKLGQSTTSADYDAILDAISDQVNALTDQRNASRMTVLQGPSFSIYGPSYALDRLLSDALRLRGATIVPIYCDSVQRVECNFYGGVWNNRDTFAKGCHACMRRSRQLWQRSPTPAIGFSEHLTVADQAAADDCVVALANDTWMLYEEDGLPLGHWAKDILVNNWVVGDYRRIANHEQLGRTHLRNLILLTTAYRSILEKIQPDRVVANDSYYGMWAILAELCRRAGIPFYAHWPTSQTRAAIAANDAPMNLDFRAAWPAFSAQALTEDQFVKVKAWLNQQSGTRELLIDTASLLAHQDVAFDLGRLDRTKPTALLPTNVIWDLAALNKQVVFIGMIDWIVETIRWFAERPQYQLIIKAHPAEQNPTIPETRERVEVALQERGVVIPDNVFLLSPKVKVTVYELLPLVKLGIVHTTSVGFEMAAHGLPVITTGRGPYRGFGFTLDASSKEEYFSLLERTLAGEATYDQAQQVDLAYKFILFYQFHYYTRLGLFESEWGKPPVIKVKSAQELLPGHNSALDYVVNSIMEGMPIVSATRWPPIS